MDAVQDVKTRLDIADVISEYLPIKPAGTGAFKAVCPFHQEKTPSFYISRTRQSWHCFGCNEGGDVISFVQRLEGMEFREALEHLAQKAGVTLPEFDKEAASARKQLYDVLDVATRFFRSALENLPQAEIARAYLVKRQVDPLTADLFRLGYAPDSWSALTDALLKKGITSEELIRAGLVGKKDQGGVYDRFRNRLMFPICDVHGHVVGFTSRILDDNAKEAKYVNTPETPLYRKSAVLYGMEKAKGEIRQKDLCVIVEGNMDVVSSHRVGIANVVAASGTALTSEQLMLIKRFTKNLAIAFDADMAGGRATLRGLDLARAQDFSIKIISLPPDAGKDPDDAIKKDPAIWAQAIANAQGIMEWVYARAFRLYPDGSPQAKKQIAHDVLTEVRRVVDPVERDHWVRKLARDLDVREESLHELLKTFKDEARTNTAVPQQPARVETPQTPTAQATEPAQEPIDPAEERLLALVIASADRTAPPGKGAILAQDFVDPRLRGLYESLVALYDHDQSLSGASTIASSHTNRPPASLTPDETGMYNRLAFLAERELQGLSPQEVERELHLQTQHVRLQKKMRERKYLEEEMRRAERIGDTARIQELLRQFETLM